MSATAKTSTPRGPRFAELRQSFSVVCYPVGSISPDATRWEAARVERPLRERFTLRATPHRIKHYDYIGLSLYAAAPTDHVGYLRVAEPVTFTTFPDAEGLFTIAVDLRLAWSEAIAQPDRPTAVTVGLKRAAA